MMMRIRVYGLVAMLWLWGSAMGQPLMKSLKGQIVHAVTQSPVAGASVLVLPTGAMVVSDEQGVFGFLQVPQDAVLQVSAVGFRTATVAVNGRDSIQVLLEPVVAALDEAIVIGYGKTSRRLSTGSVGKVDAATIERQPVTNVLAALQGRVAGLWVEQSNGLPGSNFNVEIRGRNSIGGGTRPLFVVDGVPWMQNVNPGSLATGLAPNPLNSLNPADIERVEILKDADATAIYGAAAANGVVLITTKKGGQGASSFSVNFFSGAGVVTRGTPQLATASYLAMRRIAFALDGVNPSVSTAPDLLLWDSTRYTDWAGELTGGAASLVNLQGSLRTGSKTLQVLLSGQYQSQTTVFPQTQPTTRGSGMLSVVYRGLKDRLGATLQLNYGIFNIRTPVFDLANFMYLPPNAPAAYDSTGKLTWTNWTGADNPMAQLERRFEHRNATLNSNLVLDYRLLPGLVLKATVGYNDALTEEYRSFPISSKRPAAGLTAEASYFDYSQRNWIAEPYLVYNVKKGRWKAEWTLGASWQERLYQSTSINGTQYTTDALLRNAAAAGQLSVVSGYSQYRYQSYFGRLSTHWANRYLLNLSVRQDYSSRFGPANRRALFAAVGAGWVLSEEQWWKRRVPWASFMKLRGSYGSTGNDQIGDYAFLDAWGVPFAGRYQNNLSLVPQSLFNPYLQWERNRKLELAMEGGWCQNRLMLTVAWYRNRCDNQLTGYALPTQTGFSSIADNLDAAIENSGWEIDLQGTAVMQKDWKWQMGLNLTLPQSQLLSYPDIEQTLNRFVYQVGAPLDIRFGYQYEGVDPQTGLYRFTDQNGDGRLSSTNDYVPVGRIGRRAFGGINQQLQWKGWQLDLFFQFVQQTARAWFASMPVATGSLGNQPAWVKTGAWSGAGDNSALQRYTTRAGAATTAYRNLQNSSAAIVDANYIRLKNVSVSWTIPEAWRARLRLKEARLYVQAQNMITWTDYEGGDPETANLRSLAPLRMITGGIFITL
ncbi:MAG: SusC/RagA family TonB-linked outer membrane protein [Bacteroidetes bacterium]|uniref:SusC/RagA family TonB-linked outer membrane protein n=1 Tax=Phnomibacter sp. TaxID=2836217 RepID=UPI002FDE4F97|nr:SusC/RagA family TonB-linked outer membrane protein [Bacteroidota bacterium]